MARKRRCRAKRKGNRDSRDQKINFHPDEKGDLKINFGVSSFSSPVASLLALVQ